MFDLPPDPYKALGVSKDAKLPEIRTAHRKLVLKCHPDKVQDEQLRMQKQDEFQRVQSAYELLSNDDKRREYDAMARLDSLKKEISRNSPSSAPRTPPRPAPAYDDDIRTGGPRPSTFPRPGPQPYRTTKTYSAGTSPRSWQDHVRAEASAKPRTEDSFRFAREAQERASRERMERESKERDRSERERERMNKELRARAKVENETKEKLRRAAEKSAKEKEYASREKQKNAQKERERAERERQKEDKKRDRKKEADEKRRHKMPFEPPFVEVLPKKRPGSSRKHTAESVRASSGVKSSGREQKARDNLEYAASYLESSRSKAPPPLKRAETYMDGSYARRPTPPSPPPIRTSRESPVIIDASPQGSPPPLYEDASPPTGPPPPRLRKTTTAPSGVPLFPPREGISRSKTEHYPRPAQQPGLSRAQTWNGGVHGNAADFMGGARHVTVASSSDDLDSEIEEDRRRSRRHRGRATRSPEPIPATSVRSYTINKGKSFPQEPLYEEGYAAHDYKANKPRRTYPANTGARISRPPLHTYASESSPYFAGGVKYAAYYTADDADYGNYC